MNPLDRRRQAGVCLLRQARPWIETVLDETCLLCDLVVETKFVGVHAGNAVANLAIQ